MRLLRIQVENFGTLSQFQMDLNEGINEVIQENGWGKSTLAAFLRVMFYGLEGGRKQKLGENDRMKYQPWEQGPFGGVIEFEANGKRYICTRMFGQKEKDATFRLQDAETLLDSKDYSERLGEELFGIDRESFEKTSFIDSDAIRYRGINSAIGSKVGSVSQTDDLGNYDVAQERMNNFLNKKSAKKKTGDLYQLEDAIKELERDLKKEEPTKVHADGLKAQLERENNGLKACKAERDKAQRERNELVEKRKMLQERKRKAELEEAVTTRGEALLARQRSFGEHIPTREELRNLQMAAKAMSDYGIRAESVQQASGNERLERLKRYFRSGVPSEAEVSEQIGNCNALQDGLQRVLHLEEQAEAEKQALEASEEELKRLEAAADLAAAEKKKAAAQRRLFGILALAAGVILGGVTLALRLNALLYIPAGVLLLAGLVLLLSPLLSAKVQEDTPMGEAQLIRRRQEERKQRISEIKKEQEDLAAANLAKEAAVRAFLEQREIIYSRADAESLLYEIKNYRAEYLALLREEEEKQENARKLAQEGAELRTQLEASLQGMGLAQTFLPEQHAAILEWIGMTQQKLTTYENEKREKENAEEALKSFMEARKSLDFTQLEALSEEKLVERDAELEAQLQGFSEQESGIVGTIKGIEQGLNEDYDTLDELCEKRERLEALQEQRDGLAARYAIVEKTEEYLRTAKEAFIAKFMQPVKSAFDTYYEMVTGRPGSGAEFQIDANMNIFRKEAGEYHEVETQSEGYGEVIGLCIRMALLDVMYEKEGPPVILDDPFAGMDAKHLEGTKKFLEKVAGKYQILYFTCHESRGMV